MVGTQVLTQTQVRSLFPYLIFRWNTSVTRLKGSAAESGLSELSEAQAIANVYPVETPYNTCIVQ